MYGFVLPFMTDATFFAMTFAMASETWSSSCLGEMRKICKDNDLKTRRGQNGYVPEVAVELLISDERAVWYDRHHIDIRRVRARRSGLHEFRRTGEVSRGVTEDVGEQAV